MKVQVPPIKSQGIKTKLVPWILSHVPDGCTRWVEPFLGTGVVAFNSGFEKALLADINPHVIRFYSALHKGEFTPEMVKSFLENEGDQLRFSDDNGYAHYRVVRDRFNAHFAPLDLLFLSRAGFNGMMRFSKKGNFNIPFCKKPDRFRDAYVTKITNQVRAVKILMKSEWDFVVQPFSATISQAQAGDLIYCDPPYLGRHTDYFNDWHEEQEEALFLALEATKARFILSTWHHNDWRENTAIAKFWSKFRIVTREHFYHAGAKEVNRRPIVEALVMNFEPNPKPVKPAEECEGDEDEATITEQAELALG